MGLRSGDWLDHCRILMYILSPYFVALAVCFGSLSCWNTHSRPISNALAGFSALALTVHGPFHRPFNPVQLSCCSLSRKTPPNHTVSTSLFDGGGGVLGVIGSIPPPPNTMSWCQRAGFWSHLTTTLSPSSPLNHWQTSVHVLSWAGGPCGCCRISVLHSVVCYQLFSWWLWSQLPWDHWKDPPV